MDSEIQEVLPNNILQACARLSLGNPTTSATRDYVLKTKADCETIVELCVAWLKNNRSPEPEPTQSAETEHELEPEPVESEPESTGSTKSTSRRQPEEWKEPARTETFKPPRADISVRHKLPARRAPTRDSRQVAAKRTATMELTEGSTMKLAKRTTTMEPAKRGATIELFRSALSNSIERANYMQTGVSQLEQGPTNAIVRSASQEANELIDAMHNIEVFETRAEEKEKEASHARIRQAYALLNLLHLYNMRAKQVVFRTQRVTQNEAKKEVVDEFRAAANDKYTGQRIRDWLSAARKWAILVDALDAYAPAVFLPHIPHTVVEKIKVKDLQELAQQIKNSDMYTTYETRRDEVKEYAGVEIRTFVELHDRNQLE